MRILASIALTTSNLDPLTITSAFVEAPSITVLRTWRVLPGPPFTIWIRVFCEPVRLRHLLDRSGVTKLPGVLFVVHDLPPSCLGTAPGSMEKSADGAGHRCKYIIAELCRRFCAVRTRLMLVITTMSDNRVPWGCPVGDRIRGAGHDLDDQIATILPRAAPDSGHGARNGAGLQSLIGIRRQPQYLLSPASGSSNDPRLPHSANDHGSQPGGRALLG